MQDMAFKIGKICGLSDFELTRLSLLVTLHDIGKINISEKLLTKSKPLSDDEWSILKKHPEIGYRVAIGTEDFANVAEDILAHHEWWNSRGYPQGLENSEIPLAARIFAIVDVFDALTSDRPYRKAWSREKALDHIKQESGKHFDPQIVNNFLKLISDKTL
jgi:HD-GYP domain-containing protein (c-di-GMP phosphodiesterase class II)